MFDLDKAFGFDQKKAEDGVRMNLDVDGKQFFLVRRIPNPDYERQLSQEFRRHKKIIEMETKESEQLSQKLMAEVLARTVLIGWEGIALKGKKLEFNFDNAVKMMLAYPQLRSQIMEFAQDNKNFKESDDAAEVKK